MKEEPEEKQKSRALLEQCGSQGRRKHYLKGCGQRCQMAQGAKWGKGWKPLLLQWSGRASSKEQEVRREQDVQRWNERAGREDSSGKGETEAATWRPFYVVFLLGPVSLRDREAALSYVALVSLTVSYNRSELETPLPDGISSGIPATYIKIVFQIPKLCNMTHWTLLWNLLI